MNAVVSRVLVGALASSLAAAAALAPREARADVSTFAYVCAATVTPGASVAGHAGYLVVQLNTAANCAGMGVGVAHFCSTGATDPSCDAAYVYNGDQILALYASLQSAMNAGRHVRLITNDAGNVAKQLTVMAN